MLPKVDIRLAQIVWDYMFYRQIPRTSDVIIGLGSHDLSVADDVANLYERKIAPLIVFSGMSGRVTAATSTMSEAGLMRDRALRLGVPESAIVIEELSTNTGENIRFTQRLLKEIDILPRRVTLVHKPYMLRRDYATFMKQWQGAEDVDVVCWAGERTMAEYLSRSGLDPYDTVCIMVGDLQRVRMYPERGYQIEQKIPDMVRSAYEKLVEKGYTTQLIDEIR